MDFEEAAAVAAVEEFAGEGVGAAEGVVRLGAVGEERSADAEVVHRIKGAVAGVEGDVFGFSVGGFEVVDGIDDEGLDAAVDFFYPEEVAVVPGGGGVDLCDEGGEGGGFVTDSEAVCEFCGGEFDGVGRIIPGVGSAGEGGGECEEEGEGEEESAGRNHGCCPWMRAMRVVMSISGGSGGFDDLWQRCGGVGFRGDGCNVFVRVPARMLLTTEVVVRSMAPRTIAHAAWWGFNQRLTSCCMAAG